MLIASLNAGLVLCRSLQALELSFDCERSSKKRAKETSVNSRSPGPMPVRGSSFFRSLSPPPLGCLFACSLHFFRTCRLINSHLRISMAFVLLKNLGRQSRKLPPSPPPSFVLPLRCSSWPREAGTGQGAAEKLLICSLLPKTLSLHAWLFAAIFRLSLTFWKAVKSTSHSRNRFFNFSSEAAVGGLDHFVGLCAIVRLLFVQIIRFS